MIFDLSCADMETSMCVSTAEGKEGRGWWDMDDIKKEKQLQWQVINIPTPVHFYIFDPASLQARL